MKIGLMIYVANDKKTNATRPYRAIRAIAQQAEADGFDSVWIPDHLLYRRPGGPTVGSWECWTLVAALAEATRRVEIGTLVLNNSLRNPAILAKMATAVDEVSQGRLILGLGAGWNEPEYTSFGLPFDHRVGRLEEALQIVRPLLRDGHVDFHGRYYEARECEDVPRGPRPQGPPLMIGGEGPRMIRLAAQYGDAWNIGYLSTPDTLAGPMAKIEAACQQVGRDPASIDVIPLIGLWFPEFEPEQPAIFPDPLTGTVDELVEVMRGYEELGVRHIIFQYLPYTPEALLGLSAAVRRYRGLDYA